MKSTKRVLEEKSNKLHSRLVDLSVLLVGENNKRRKRELMEEIYLIDKERLALLFQIKEIEEKEKRVSEEMVHPSLYHIYFNSHEPTFGDMIVEQNIFLRLSPNSISLGINSN